MDKDALDARDQLTFCFIGGVFGSVLGLVLVALSASGFVDWIGTIIAGLSSLLVIVSAVGWGVSLGVRASGRFPGTS
jgi:ammonia channel protein AmtB